MVWEVFTFASPHLAPSAKLRCLLQLGTAVHILTLVLASIGCKSHTVASCRRVLAVLLQVSTSQMMAMVQKRHARKWTDQRLSEGCWVEGISLRCKFRIAASNARYHDRVKILSNWDEPVYIAITLTLLVVTSSFLTSWMLVLASYSMFSNSFPFPRTTNASFCPRGACQKDKKSNR